MINGAEIVTGKEFICSKLNANTTITDLGVFAYYKIPKEVEMPYIIVTTDPSTFYDSVLRIGISKTAALITIDYYVLYVEEDTEIGQAYTHSATLKTVLKEIYSTISTVNTEKYGDNYITLHNSSMFSNAYEPEDIETRHFGGIYTLQMS